MLAGTYFYYCTEASTKTKQVFRYRYLRTQRSKDEAVGKSHHPVFVMISPNAISFYIEPIPAKGISENGEPNGAQSFHLLQLFSLPLYPKDSKLDRLTESIINLCNENGVDRKNNYLTTNKALFDNNYVIHNDENIEKDGLLRYWVIFQHFLYDLSFSDVFQNASAYEEAVIRLRENYFVNCIIAKCEYKFWSIKFSANNLNEYIQNKFWEADKNWVNLIIDEKNNQILEVSHNWFGGAERELRALLKINFDEFPTLLNFNQMIFHNNREKLLQFQAKAGGKFKVKEIKIQRDGIYHFFLQRFSTWSIEKFVFMYNTELYVVSLMLLYLLLSLNVYYFFASHQSIFFLIISLLGTGGITQGMIKPLIFFTYNSIVNLHTNYNILFKISLFFYLRKKKMVIDNLVNIEQKLVDFAQREKDLDINKIKWAKVYTHNNMFRYVNFYNHSVGYPKMSLAIIAIWLGYIPVCEEAWQINVLLGDFTFAFYYSFLMIIIFSFIFYFVNDVHFGNNSLLGIRKSSALFIKGMSVSVAFGLFAMEASRENIFDSPADFFPKEIGISRIDTLSKTIDSIEFELLAHHKVDSVQTLRKHFPVIKKYLPVKSQNEIGDSTHNSSTLFNDLVEVKNSLIIGLTNNHMEGRDFWKVPAITNFNLFKHNFFIFPKLLLTYSAFAFFIGLFAQVAFQGSNYKENL